MFTRQHANQSEKTNVAQEQWQKTDQTPTVLAQGAHSRTILQRAKIDPGSLTPADVAQLHRTIGNRAVGRLWAGRGVPQVQPKLTLGPVGDKYEQEADRVARQVVSTITASSQQPVQREVDEEEEPLQMKPVTQWQVEEQEEPLQMKSQSTTDSSTLEASEEATIQQAQGGGQPLTDGVRAPMERAFGADFSRVRIHNNAESDRLNRSLSARAFTTGQDIFFRQGEYSPSSASGQEIIAHELTHVVQQNGHNVQRAWKRTKGAVINGTKMTAQSLIQRVYNIRYVGFGSKHQDENRRFLTSKVTPNQADNKYLLARAAAFLLDHDIENWRLIPKYFSEIEQHEGVGVVEALRFIFRNSMTHLTQLRSVMNTYIKEIEPGAQLSDIQWSKPFLGMGTGVKADLKPDGHPEGSDAGGAQPWIVILQHRADDDKTLYIRGHLLNRHLGGPGVDYNMVPLTGRSGWHGANHANEIHSDIVEEQVKGKYEAMKTKGRKQVTRLKYAVKAEWGQPARGAKKEVAELTGLFKAIKDDIYNSLAGNVAWNGKPIDTLTESDINKSQFLRESRPRINVATQFEIFPRFVALPLPEYKKYLKRYYVTQNFYSKKISAWPPSRFTPLANYVEMKDADLLLLLEAVCADKSGNWQDSTVEELQARLDENLQLWDCEEKLVPLKLNVVAKWVQGGKEGGITPRIVPIDLPNEFDAPFNARKDLY